VQVSAGGAVSLHGEVGGKCLAARPWASG
jgi:hypothetical protein